MMPGTEGRKGGRRGNGAQKAEQYDVQNHSTTQTIQPFNHSKKIVKFGQREREKRKKTRKTAVVLH